MVAGRMLLKKVVDMDIKTAVGHGNDQSLNLQLLKEEKFEDIVHSSFRFKNVPCYFGQSLASFIRRSLFLMTGCCFVFSFHIEGLQSVYDLMDNVKEDVLELMLNLRNVILDFEDNRNFKIINIKISGPCSVNAGMFQSDDVKIYNPDMHIMTVCCKEDIDLKIMIVNNKFCRERSTNDIICSVSNDLSPNWINVNNSEIVSHVYNVKYEVKNGEHFSGNSNSYDEIDFHISTSTAFNASDMMNALLRKLRGYCDVCLDSISSYVTDNMIDLNFNSTVKEVGDNGEINALLATKIEDLDLSVRSLNCLHNENISYVWQLVQKDESEMMKTANFGRKSLDEIKSVLLKMGLKFGMKIDDTNITDEEIL